jgi:hypothetical protein
MSNQENSMSKSSHSSTWNAVRSKSIPSGVSGQHSVARSTAPVATDESILNEPEQIVLRARKPLRSFQPMDPAFLKP